MNKIFKRALCLTCVLLGGLTLMSCKTEKTPDSDVVVIEGRPDYSSLSETNVLRIGAWVAPPAANWNGMGNPDFATFEQYQAIKDSGINVIYALYENANHPVMKRVTEYCAQLGIKYLGRDTGMDVDPDLLELEEGEFRLRAKDYYQMDSFAGHLITDEPGASKFERLGRLKKYYEKEFPDKEFYINLFPTYASPAQIECDSYAEYIDQYISYVQPDFVSLDHYPLMVDGYGNYKITEDVLSNLEIVATRCKDANIPMYNFIQSMSYSATSRCPDEAEVRWQVLTNMAYGSKSIQYFCYFTPLEFKDGEGTPAMIDKEGNKTPQYYAVQTVNRELSLIDEAYLAYDWDATMVVSGTNATSTNKAFLQLEHAITEHEMIKSIVASEDALVGTFTGKDNRTAFLITNFSDPKIGNNNTVSITFHNATHALVYHYGVAEYVELDNGRLDYTLDKGDGIFVIPYR